MTDPAPEHSAFDAEPVLTLEGPATPKVTGRWSVLRTWTRTRWGIGAAAAALAAAALVFANGAFVGAALPGALWIGLLVQMFAGLPLDAIRSGVQPAVGGAAVVLVAAALSGRLRLERAALADPANAEACATCTPLFPGRR